MAPESFPKFLSLPAEIRLMIYEYHYLDNTPPTDYGNTMVVQPWDSEDRIPGPLDLHFTPDHTLTNISTSSLLQTNAQIRHEALEILSTKFAFKLSTDREYRVVGLAPNCSWPALPLPKVRPELFGRVRYVYMDLFYQAHQGFNIDILGGHDMGLTPDAISELFPKLRSVTFRGLEYDFDTRQPGHWKLFWENWTTCGILKLFDNSKTMRLYSRSVDTSQLISEVESTFPRHWAVFGHCDSQMDFINCLFQELGIFDCLDF